MDQHHYEEYPSERTPISRPQIFVHLEFGLSWSQRHQPRTHAVTYTSRNLRDSRTLGNFPRLLPPSNANFLTPDGRQQTLQEPQGYTDRQNYQQQQQYDFQPQDQHPDAGGTQNQRTRRNDQGTGRIRSRPLQNRETTHTRRSSRSESRGLSHERGKSAPPPFHDSPWDATSEPSASLFPVAGPGSPEELRHLKPLPPVPDSFRLGEDGLPWSAWAWPADPHERRQSEEDEDGLFYSNQPTTVAISPLRHRSDDPERARELESLSAAMVTVDNGFESQWWHQGPRETTAWWPRDQEEPSRLSMADALLLSAPEPPTSTQPHDWYAPCIAEQASYLDGTVSPISTASPRPLQRSMTTRSEELFITSAR